MWDKCPMKCHGIVSVWSRNGHGGVTKLKEVLYYTIKSHNKFDIEMNACFKKAQLLVLDPFHKKAKGKVFGTKNKVFY